MHTMMSGTPSAGITTDIICSLIDASPWGTLNALSRLDKASSAYARSMRAVKLAIWTHLGGDRTVHFTLGLGAFKHRCVNFACMVLPNERIHGRAIMRDITERKRFVVEYHLGEPVQWSREVCEDASAPIWKPVAFGMCHPARAHMTTKSGLPAIGVIVQGHYLLVVIDGTKCSIIQSEEVDMPIVVECARLVDTNSLWRRNQWYEMNVARRIDNIVGDRIALDPATFAKAIARFWKDDEVAWFNKCHPLLVEPSQSDPL